MNIQINSCKLILELIDTETGEIITQEATLGDFKEKKASTRTRKVKDDGEAEPMIHVLENKLQFNNKAIELTGFESDNKVIIDFEKRGRKITPICHLGDKGNRMTKTFTVSYRGQQRDTLLQYGDNFTLVPYPDKDGYFKLIGDVAEVEDDIIDIPQEEEVVELPESDDIDDIDFNF